MAANAILQPSKFSISSMAILQQTSSSLRWSFYQLLHTSKEAPKHLRTIKNTYDSLKIDNVVSDGTNPYPNEDLSSHGMSLDVRYATTFLPSTFI